MMSKVVVMLKTINILYLFVFSLCRSTPGGRGKGILGPWERG